MEPKVVVKVRRPTEDAGESDSDFEVVSDSGNDEVFPRGYERLNDGSGASLSGNEDDLAKPEADQLEPPQNHIVQSYHSCSNLQSLQEPEKGPESVERSTRFIDRINSILGPHASSFHEPAKAERAPEIPEKRLSDSALSSKVDSLAPLEIDRKFSVPNTLKEDSPPAFFPYRTVGNLNEVAGENSSYRPHHLMKERQTSITDLLPDKLKCEICKSLYRDPRVLNCLHSFCLQCLIDNDKSGAPWTQSRKGSVNSEFEWNFNKKDLSFCESIFSNETERMVVSPKPMGSIASSTSEGAKSKKNSKGRSSAKEGRRSSAVTYAAEKPKMVICWTCGLGTEMPIGGHCRIPQNFVLMRQIDAEVMKTGVQQVARIWCFLCSSESIATCFCVDCGINLCSFCREAHKRQRSTCFHEIKVFVEANKSKPRKSDATRRMALKCPLHISSDLKIFCTVCTQVVCNDCTIILHRTHKCITLTKASRVYMRQINDHLERTKPLTDYAFHSKVKMNEISKKVNQKCEQVQNDVEIYLAEYFQALEVHRKTLLNQINRARESKMELILARQTDLERRCQEARQAINFTEELLLDSSDVEKLSFAGILIKRFEHCQKSQTSAMDAKISDSLQFLPEVKAPSNKAQNNIPLYGIITTQTASAKCCCLEKTEGLMNLRVHKKAELILISKDGDNRQMCHGGLTINIDLHYKENATRSLPTQVSDKRDGTYTISFTPDAPGKMILTINIDGKGIKDSPFTIRSTALRPHSGIYHCCSFCSTSGSKTAVCACGSRMPGGYAGCGHGHPGHPGRRHWSCCSSVLENSECSVSNAAIYQSSEVLDQ